MEKFRSKLKKYWVFLYNINYRTKYYEKYQGEGEKNIIVENENETEEERRFLGLENDSSDTIKPGRNNDMNNETSNNDNNDNRRLRANKNNDREDTRSKNLMRDSRGMKSMNSKKKKPKNKKSTTFF